MTPTRFLLQIDAFWCHFSMGASIFITGGGNFTTDFQLKNDWAVHLSMGVYLQRYTYQLCALDIAVCSFDSALLYFCCQSFNPASIKISLKVKLFLSSISIVVVLGTFSENVLRQNALNDGIIILKQNLLIYFINIEYRELCPNFRFCETISYPI